MGPQERMEGTIACDIGELAFDSCISVLGYVSDQTISLFGGSIAWVKQSFSILVLLLTATTLAPIHLNSFQTH